MGLVGIDFRFPSWEKKIKKARREIDLFIAATMQTNRGMLFDNEGAYNGHRKWHPLKFRQGQILTKRGTLRKSIAPISASGRPGRGGIVEFSGDMITIGTKLGYAKLMNDGTVNLPGGVLKAKNAKALAIPLPSGKQATPAAKELRKGASGKKSLQGKIEKMRQSLSDEPDPARRMALENQIVRLQKAHDRGPKNQKVIFRKSVKIPPRPFDTWTEEDDREMEEALKNKIQEILNR